MDELVRRAQHHDGLAMSALLRELSPYVGRICGAIALGEGDDAMQETMIQVFRRIGTVRDVGAFRGWVRQIAVREAVRTARRGGDARPVADAAAATAAAPAVDLDTVHDVRATLAALSPEHRAVLVLRDLEGLSEAEAAAALDIAQGTAKSRLARARDAFRRRWQP